MIFITEQEFEYKELQSLYFYSTWMPFHKKMCIMIDKIESSYSDMQFLAIDVDAFPNLCKKFKVDSVPTVIILNNGQEKKRIIGLPMTSAIKSVYNDIYTLEKI